MEEVILVTGKDEVVGSMEKLDAHKKGLLHRAISILVFNTKGEFLLQKRAVNKYHSPNLWTNTTCSHPRPNENNLTAAVRRLKEEMGIFCELENIKSFKYKAFLENGLVEHELDHIFIGITNATPAINLNEAVDFKYISYLELITDIQQYPEKYTVWFKIILKEAEDEIFKIIKKTK